MGQSSAFTVQRTASVRLCSGRSLRVIGARFRRVRNVRGIEIILSGDPNQRE
jgi:hypothetical protein